MGSIFINIRANIQDALSGLSSLVTNLRGFSNAARDARKASQSLAQGVQLLVREMRTFGNIFLVIGRVLRESGLQQFGDVVTRLGQSFRLISSVLAGTNTRFTSLSETLARLIRQSPTLSSALSGLGRSLDTVAKGANAFTLIRKGVQAAIDGVARFSGNIQQLGFVVGILSIQFDKLRRQIRRVFEPILAEGVELQRVLDEVRSVSVDLNENYARFSNRVSSSGDIIENVSGLLRSAAGNQEDFTDQVLRAAEGLGDIGSDGEQFDQFITRLNNSLPTTQDGLRAVTVELRSLRTEGLNASQAVQTLTARRNFQDLENQIIDLALATKFTAKELADGAKFLALAGLSFSEIEQSLPRAAALAAAGSLEVARAADIATNAMLAFGLEASSLDRVINDLAITQANANTSVEQLGTALRYVAPFAEQLGISLEETLAALGKLGDVGLQGSVAGTSLANAFRALAKRGDNFNNVLEELNLTYADLDPNLNSLVDIVRTLEEASISTSQAIRLFQARGARGILPLIRQGAEALQELVDLQNDLDFSALDVAAQRIDNISGKLLILQSQASAIAQKIFRPLEASINNILNYASALLRALGAFVDQNGELIASLGQLVFAVFAASSALAGFFTIISGPLSLAGVITGLATVAAAFFEVSVPIAALGAGITALATTISSSFLPIIAAVPQVIDDLEVTVKSLYDNALRPFLESFLSTLRLTIKYQVVPALQEFLRALRVPTSSADEYAQLGQNIAVSISLIAEKLLQLAKIIASVENRFSRIAQIFYRGSGLSALFGVFRDGGAVIDDFNARTFAQLVANFTGLPYVIRRVIDTLRTSFYDIPLLLKDILTGAFFEVDDTLNSVSETLEKSFEDTIDLMKEFNSVGERTKRLYSDVYEGLKDFSFNTVQENERLLEALEKVAEESGEENFIIALDNTIASQKEQLDAIEKARDELAAQVRDETGVDDIFVANIQSEIAEYERQLRSLTSNISNLEEIRREIQNLIDTGVFRDGVLADDVINAIRLGEIDARNAADGIKYLTQAISSLKEASRDLEIDIEIQGLEQAGRVAEAARRGLELKFREESQTLEDEIALLRDQILTITELGGADADERLPELERKLQELLRRQRLLIEKFSLDLENIEQDEQQRRDDADEKRRRAVRDAARFEADTEIEFLEAIGKEAEAIRRRFEEDVLRAREEISELEGLTQDQKNRLEERRVAILRAERDEALAALEEQQAEKLAEREQIAQDALEHEREIFKTLLGEVKSVQDLVALYVILDRIRAARVRATQNAALRAQRISERLVEVEDRLAAARERGADAQAASLERERQRLQVLAATAVGVARNAAEALGLDDLAALFERREVQVPGLEGVDNGLQAVKNKVLAFIVDLEDMLINQGTAIFVIAARTWADGFIEAWEPASLRILGAIQNMVDQANIILRGIQIPDLFGGLPQAGAGGAVAGGPADNRRFEINVANNLGVGNLNRAFANVFAQAGVAAGRV